MEYNNRIFKSILYLIWILFKENWKIILGIVVFCGLIWTPLAYFLTKDDGGIVGYFAISTIVFMPIILSSMIAIPILYQQISSTSIRDRLLSVGMSFRMLTITMVLFFTVVLLAMFYILLPIFAILFNEVIWLDPGGPIDSEGNRPLVEVIQFHATYGWFNILFLTPILMFGLSSIGCLIANIKIKEIFKGILVIFLLLLFFINQATMNPIYYWIPSNQETMTSAALQQRINQFYLLSLNPFGTISYSLQTTINSEMVWQGVPNGYYDIIANTLATAGTSMSKMVTITQIISVLYSFGFFGLAFYTSK